MRLALFGNGLDLAHGMPTTYNDFRVWMKAWPQTPAINTLLRQINAANDTPWTDFETCLTTTLEAAAVREGDNINVFLGLINSGDHDDLVGYSDPVWTGIEKTRCLLAKLFACWAHQLDPDPAEIHPVAYIETILADVDRIVTFNYTHTLELVYGVDPSRILHIHGDAKSPDDIIFGGPDNQADASTRKERPYELHSKDLNASLHGKFVKRPQLDRFDSWTGPSVAEVQTFGFSFGPSDQVYVESLIRHSSCRTDWRNYYHDERGKRACKTALAKFRGRLLQWVR